MDWSRCRSDSPDLNFIECIFLFHYNYFWSIILILIQYIYGGAATCHRELSESGTGEEDERGTHEALVTPDPEAGQPLSQPSFGQLRCLGHQVVEADWALGGDDGGVLVLVPKHRVRW